MSRVGQLFLNNFRFTIGLLVVERLIVRMHYVDGIVPVYRIYKFKVYIIYQL